MTQRSIFEILIYRLSPEKREIEIKNKKAIIVDDSLKRWGTDASEKKEVRMMAEKSFALSFDGRPWKYNNVIGCIEISVDKLQITGKYWLVDGRIQSNMKDRVVRYHDKVMEIWITESDTSQSIQKKISIDLSEMKLKWPFVGRYVDTSAFDTLSLFIDWKKLTESIE
jgi:hypothetical protein